MYVNLILVCSRGSFGFTNLKCQVSGKLTSHNIFLQKPFILPAGVSDFKIRQNADLCSWGYLCFAYLGQKSTNSHSCNYIMIWTALSRSTVDHRSLHWGKRKWVEIFFEDVSYVISRHLNFHQNFRFNFSCFFQHRCLMLSGTPNSEFKFSRFFFWWYCLNEKVTKNKQTKLIQLFENS